MEFDSVREKYNLVARRYPDPRSCNSINIRLYNNFVKSVVINKYLYPKFKVLDIACGRGGDLEKYRHVPDIKYVGVDFASDAVAKAKRRSQKFKINTTFHIMDFFRQDVTIDTTDGLFDLISCQLALHYAFDTQKHINLTCKNISAHLKVGGHVLISVPRKSVIEKLQRESQVFESDYIKIVFKGTNKYSFTMAGSVEDVDEYKVDHLELTNAMAKQGLTLISSQDFYTIYKTAHSWADERILSRFSLPKLDFGEQEAVSLYEMLVFKKIT